MAYSSERGAAHLDDNWTTSPEHMKCRAGEHTGTVVGHIDLIGVSIELRCGASAAKLTNGDAIFLSPIDLGGADDR